MLNPKKTIPKLAAATLALTGCGGDGGGGAADFDASLSAFCMNVAPCFNEMVQSCTNYYIAVNNYNDNPQCEALMITYFDCSATKTCDQILVQGVCDDEYYAAWNVCEELP